MNSLISALQLFSGALFFTVIGSIFTRRLKISKVGFAVNNLIGQSIVIFLIYLQSNVSYYLISTPIYSVEILSIGILSLLYGISCLKKSRGFISFNLLSALFLAVGIALIAYFELPKLQMLSSDPDAHIFFASQIRFYGAIPFHRLEWDFTGFNYPAGSGALIFAWHALTFLSLQNVLSALPFIESLIAVMALIQIYSDRINSPSKYFLVAIPLLLLTAGFFLIPLMADFFHQEGVGRVMSIGFMVSFVTILLLITKQLQRAEHPSSMLFILGGLQLFLLAVLNPVNIVIPLLMVFSILILHLGCGYRNIFLLFLGYLIPAALIFLDPYYIGRLVGEKSGGGIDVTLPSFSLQLINQDFILDIIKNIFSIAFIKEVMGFLPSQSNGYMFIMIFIPFILFAKLKKINFFKVSIGLIFLALLLITCSTFYLLRGYSPFYILYPYLIISIAQYKIILYQCFAIYSFIVVLNSRQKWRNYALVLMCIFISLFIVMRTISPEVFKSRKNYCGSLGCVNASDIVVLEKFKDYRRGLLGNEPDMNGKLLLPNFSISTGIENWIFPYAGSRVAPLFDVAPIAFYYFQGSADYSSKNYLENVCKNFNKKWLKERNIAYLFLPSELGPSCIYNLNESIKSMDILIKDGNSAILKIE